MANSFIDQYKQAAMKIERETGVPASLILAQAALESGNGQHAPGNNFFGIKGNGPAGYQSLMTTEVVNGRPVKMYQNFRKYNSPEESFRDHARLIASSPYYSDVMEAAKTKDIKQIADAIGRSPYATDPGYGQKIYNAMKKNGLDNLDKNPVIAGIVNALKVPQVEAADVSSIRGDFDPQQITQNKKAELPNDFVKTISTQKNAFPLPSMASKIPQPMNKSVAYASQPNIVKSNAYTVQKGDTLSGIAQKLYGDPNKWRQLQGYSGDPRKLPIGTQITR